MLPNVSCAGLGNGAMGAAGFGTAGFAERLIGSGVGAGVEAGVEKSG